MSDNYEQQRLKAGGDFAQGSLDAQKSFTEDDIRKDPSFSEAYKLVHKYINNEDIEDSQDNLANYGMQFISDVKNPIYTVDDGLGLAGTYAKFKDAPKEVKESLWYMWDRYDEADMTMAAFGRGLKSIGKDPSTYMGIGAGIKLFGSKAAGHVATKKIKEMLLSGAVTGAYTGGEEVVKQEVQDVEEYDWDKINEMATIGAVIGVVAPPAIEGAVKGTIAGTKVVGQKISDTIQEGEELMMQQAGGGVPPREKGENILAYAKRKEEFYKENPELRPSIPQQKKIETPNREEVLKRFSNLKSFEGYNESIKRTIIDKPFKTPKIKIYRGESEYSGSGAAMFGSGLYSTTNKNLAKKYGKVREVSTEELPKNPIQFETELDFKQFEYELAKDLGIDKRDISKNIGQIDEYLREMGYDGMSVGKGRDAFFVTFPKDSK